MPSVLSVNVARPRVSPAADDMITGIDKRPTAASVGVRAPGASHGSGLVGDVIGDRRAHGGDDQAVYVYAREDLDAWQSRLSRDIANGVFGENLTTSGLDVTDAVIGERWQVGHGGLVLEVSRPRIPCRTFAEWLEINGWIKTFTQAAIPGAYLRLVSPGPVRVGDEIVVVDRPRHGVTIGVVFRALTLEPDLLPELLRAPALPDKLKDVARQRS